MHSYCREERKKASAVLAVWWLAHPKTRKKDKDGQDPRKKDVPICGIWRGLNLHVFIFPALLSLPPMRGLVSNLPHPRVNKTKQHTVKHMTRVCLAWVLYWHIILSYVNRWSNMHAFSPYWLRLAKKFPRLYLAQFLPKISLKYFSSNGLMVWCDVCFCSDRTVNFLVLTCLCVHVCRINHTLCALPIMEYMKCP